MGWSIQHRKKRSVGGGSGLSNLLTLCGSGTTGCHGWCETWPQKAEEVGWAVPSWADPARWPVRHHLHGWVLLDDAGLWAPV